MTNNSVGSPANAGSILSIFGAANSAIGTYFDIRSQKIASKSQESSLRFQQSISDINARAAEDRALGIESVGQREVGRFTMQAGAEKSRRTASLAASGVQIGAGSAAEIQASGDILAKIDRFSIEANIARSVAAARTQAVNARTQGSLAGISAQNISASRDTLSPLIGVSTSLLNSAGTISREWRYAQRGHF